MLLMPLLMVLVVVVMMMTMMVKIRFDFQQIRELWEDAAAAPEASLSVI